MSQELYREQALAELSSPEQLHTLMRVTDVRGYLMLFGCSVMVVAGMAFSIWGRIPTKVEASGILLHPAGLSDAVSLSEGQVTALAVEVGDFVRAGQTLARVAQPQLKTQLSALREEERELSAFFERRKQRESQDAELNAEVSAQTRAGLRASVRAARLRKGDLEARLARQRGLYEKGLVTHEALLSTRQELRHAESEAGALRAEMRRVSAERIAAAGDSERDLEAERLRLQQLRRDLGLAQAKWEAQGVIKSAHDGRVVEVRVGEGDVVREGQTLLSLERAESGQGGLQALLYLDAATGKRVQAGMQVQLAPATVKRERHGLVLGEVLTVDDFPATRRGMQRTLRNEQLVDAFLEATSGVPIAVRVRLRKAEASPSGYRWTSGAGPQGLLLTSGTPCTASIILREQRPLSLLLPGWEAW